MGQQSRAISTSWPDEQNALTVYRHEMSRIPMLSAEDEKRLAMRIEAGRAESLLPASSRNMRVIEEGKQAHRQFFEANLRLVVDQAENYRDYSDTVLTLLDLIQEGNLGLLRAMETFDYRRGYKFSTYATWWIRQAVSRAHDEQSRQIRVPTHMSQKINRVHRAIAALSEPHGVPPERGDLAAYLGVEDSWVQETLSWDYQCVSLEKPLREAEDKSLGSLLEDKDAPDVLELAAQAEVVTLVREALEHAPLTARERRVIELRYGLFRHREHTLDETARLLKPSVSRERVRQLEVGALAKLRPYLQRAREAAA